MNEQQNKGFSTEELRGIIAIMGIAAMTALGYYLKNAWTVCGLFAVALIIERIHGKKNDNDEWRGV